jgi:hypothetical protein
METTSSETKREGEEPLRPVDISGTGLSRPEQLQVVLGRILANDGVAQMRDIYQAVNKRLRAKGLTLSTQGQASLRELVNRYAVREGYVDPYNRKNPGWRITAKGRHLLESSRPLVDSESEYLTEDPVDERSSLEGMPGANITHGAGFGTPEQNRKVEVAAVMAATKELVSRGWHVRSVERDRVGYDLHCCQHGRADLHVEVKGLQGDAVAFLMTDAEVRRAKSDNDFALCLVAHALLPSVKVELLCATDFLHQFCLRPVTFQAMRRKIGSE